MRDKKFEIMFLNPELGERIRYRAISCCNGEYRNQITTENANIVKLSYPPGTTRTKIGLYMGYLVTIPHGAALSAFKGPSADPTLVISSIAFNERKETENLKSTKAIIARCNIYYNKGFGSEDTSRDSGYALDIPKDVGTIRKLLKSDSVLEALATRNFEEINTALGRFNKGMSKPILTTPYLKDITE